MNVYVIALIVVAASVAVLGVLLSIAYRKVVPTNMTHIVQGRKHPIIYGKDQAAGNVYYAWPTWVPRFGIAVTVLPESNFQVTLKDYEAYDLTRLGFKVDVTAFFRISDPQKASQRVPSIEALKLDLAAVLQGSVRSVLASNSLESIMQSRSDLAQQFTTAVTEQISEWGVCTVKAIEFMDIRDTDNSVIIANIMAKAKSRIDMESRVSVAENRRVALGAEIDADRTVAVQKQDAEQQVGLRTAEKEQLVGIANQESEQNVLVSSKVTAERRMDVKTIELVRQAEIERDVALVRVEQERKVAVVNAEALKQTQVVNAEGVKDAQIVRAEGDKQATIAKADGDLQASLKDAQGIKARGEATASAETAMLMAPVDAQIKLSTEIGNNVGYQQYLVTTAQINAGRDVGIEMAKALQTADLKVIANSGDVQTGVASLGDILSTNGGMKLTGMLSALGQTEEGKALLAAVGGKLPALATAAGVAAVTGSPVAGAVAGVIPGAVS